MFDVVVVVESVAVAVAVAVAETVVLFLGVLIGGPARCRLDHNRATR